MAPRKYKSVTAPAAEVVPVVEVAEAAKAEAPRPSVTLRKDGDGKQKTITRKKVNAAFIEWGTQEF